MKWIRIIAILVAQTAAIWPRLAYGTAMVPEPAPLIEKVAENGSAGTSFETQLEKFLKPVKLEDPLIITDQKLQADEGSLSKYSLKFNLSYAGPGITDLENKDQPNPDHVVNVFQTKMIGSIGGRYRIDGVSAVNAGTGISAIHPLHGWDRTDVNSPFISYDRSARYSDIQIRQALSSGLVTTPEYVASGEVASAAYEIDLVKELGRSRFSAGLDSRMDYFFYNRPYSSANKSDRGSAQNYFSFYPNIKYKVTDKLNINSSLSFMYYNARQLDDRLALWGRTLTQKIGIGYSFARDIYLTPYLSIYPREIASDTTTFNLGAVFSIL